jgi:hypothetical protein
MALLFWSAAVLVAFPGRILAPHLFLLWLLGIAVLWGGALPLAHLRARSPRGERRGWELGALVTGAPGGVIEEAARVLGVMGAEEIEASPPTGTARARLPGRPPLRIRLHVLAEGAGFRLLAEAEPVRADPEEMARGTVRALVEGLSGEGWEVRAGEERSWPLPSGCPRWVGYVAAAAAGIAVGVVFRLVV